MKRGVRRAAVAGVAGLLLAAVGWGWYRASARSRVHWRPPGGRPYEGVLHARLVGTSGPPIVLLHGFLGSGRSWGADFDQLGAHHRLIVPDLMGFGESPKPASGYSLDEHAEAVAELLTELQVREPVVLAGHSFGAVVALHLAAKHPDLVVGVVGFGPPLYPTPQRARERTVRGDPMGGMLILDTPLARRTCIWVHEHTSTATRLVRLLRPDLPPEIARDAARHTWESYSGTLEGMIETGDADELLRQAGAPVRLVWGDEDRVVDAGYLEQLASRHRNVAPRIVTDAGHDLPLTHPQLCRRTIELAARADR